MFPDSNRRQTSLEKLKPKRHSAKALRLLPSILRGNKSIFHMTLSARGVLWLFLTIAVPAGAVHLTWTVFQQRWQTFFSQGRRLPRHFRGGEPSLLETAALPAPALAFLGWSNHPRGHDGGSCNVQCGACGTQEHSLELCYLPTPMLAVSGMLTASTNRNRCWEGWPALPRPISFPLLHGSFPNHQPSPGQW